MGIVAYLATKELLGEPEVVLATLIIGSILEQQVIILLKCIDKYGKRKRARHKN